MKISFPDCVEGFDAHTIKGYVLHDIKSSTNVEVPYPKEEGITSGTAFHHGRFVMALRKAAQEEEK